VTSDLLGRPATGPDAPRWMLARFIQATLAPLFRAIYRVRVLGLENVPTVGGYVLAGNHVSYLDPVLLWCVVPKETHFVAKSELFDNALIRWVATRVWAFPISRASADREAIARATSLLQRGEPVGMFPEGTRRRGDTPVSEDNLGEAHSGVAFIAARAGVPVVPVGISGTDRALPAGAKLPRFPRVTIRFGEAVSSEGFTQGGRKEKMAAMTAEIMRRIAEARDTASRER
jgi:1-acyl-sn-glycerol-3-phosphate acyltransferase